MNQTSESVGMVVPSNVCPHTKHRVMKQHVSLRAIEFAAHTHTDTEDWVDIWVVLCNIRSRCSKAEGGTHGVARERNNKPSDWRSRVMIGPELMRIV